jgi:hypothetical protein
VLAGVVRFSTALNQSLLLAVRYAAIWTLVMEKEPKACLVVRAGCVMRTWRQSAS